MVSLFVLGVGILAGALVLNYLGSRLGLPSWYDFVEAPSTLTALSAVWLFVLYPFGLGTTAYLVEKLFRL